MKTCNIFKIHIIMVVLTLFCPAIVQGAWSVLLYDDFDDGDYDGWSATNWKGEPWPAPDVVPSPEGYSLRGVGSGYSTPPPVGVWISHPVSISDVTELKIEMRAKSGPEWPNVSEVYLCSGNDFYCVMDQGEAAQSAHFVLYVAEQEEYRYMHAINANIWHDFAWSRDNDGWWSLSIDGEVVAPNFHHDNQLNSFDRIGLEVLRNQSEIEWVRISGNVIPATPKVTTEPATDIGTTSAKLNAQITDDGGEACQYRFRYKKSGGSYNYTSWTGSLTTGQSFSENIAGLTPGSTYYFNCQAKNSTGESDWGNEENFTTPLAIQPPSVTTEPATNVGTTSAKLNAQITDDGGEACQYRFRYKKSGGSYNYTSWTGSLTTGQSFSENIAGLSPGSTYYFNSQAKNSAGESGWGNERSFVTTNPIPATNQPPAANAGSDQNVLRGTEVTLNGSCSNDPDNDIVYFNWYEGHSFLGSGEVIRHTFPLGRHTITLEVTDSVGQSDSDEVIIIVVNQFREYLTEYFSGGSDDFDLSYKSIIFTPASGGSSLPPCLQQINRLPTDHSRCIDLILGDDEYELVSLNDQKTVSIFGSRFSSFYIGSNGYISFANGGNEFSWSLSDHFETKRISGLLVDLDPSTGGTVSYIQLPDRMSVTWRDIPEYGKTNSNTFQVDMYFDGRIQIAWLMVDAHEGIVGLSGGLGLPADFRETNFSEYQQCAITPRVNPIADWEMDNNADNTTVTDSSGNGNHGIARRNTSVLSTTGKTNGALTFNGSRDYIDCGNNSSLNLTDNFTIAAWIKPRSFSWLAGIVSKYHTVEANSYFLRLNRNSPYNKLEFGGKSCVTSQIGLDANQWYFIVAMRDSGTGKIYINGNLDNSSAVSISSSSDPVLLGVDYQLEPRYFDGLIDNVMIFNRTLSVTEIGNLYSSGKL